MRCRREARLGRRTLSAGQQRIPGRYRIWYPMSPLSPHPHFMHPSGPHSFFNLRRPSLARGSLLVLASFAIAFPLSGFPDDRRNLLLMLPAVFAVLGTLDTMRCVQRRWNLYHGGVILLLTMDMMAICLVLFFLLAPYLI